MRREDLADHCCINVRLPTEGGLNVREFTHAGRPFNYPDRHQLSSAFRHVGEVERFRGLPNAAHNISPTRRS